MIERTVHRLMMKTKVCRSSRLITGIWYGYGIGVLYRIYKLIELPIDVSRSPYQSSEARSAILSHVTRRVRQSAFASTFALFSSLYFPFFPFSFIIHPLFILSLISSFLVFFFLITFSWVKIFNLPSARIYAASIELFLTASGIDYIFKPRDLFKSETFNIRALLHFRDGLERNCY